jgi:hypothetical protein
VKMKIPKTSTKITWKILMRMFGGHGNQTSQDQSYYKYTRCSSLLESWFQWSFVSDANFKFQIFSNPTIIINGWPDKHKT